MGIMKLIKGSPEPDRNDPKNKERREREIQAGRDFADKVGLSWLSRKIYSWSSRHKRLFLVIVFGTVILCFVLNIVHVVQYVNRGGSQPTAVDRVDSLVEHRNDIN